MKHQQKNFCKLFKLFPTVGLVLYSSLFVCISSKAQELAEMQAQKGFENAVNEYDSYLSKNSFLYTGSSYVAPYSGIIGHQFFVDDYWEQGNIIYDQSSFDSIYLKYDIYTDNLLIENFGLNGLPSHMKLYGPKVTYFLLHGYTFIRIENDTLSNMKEGFYNLLYDGASVQAVAKRRKEIIASHEQNTIREIFIQKDKFYIKKGGKYNQVRNKKSILKVLEDRKKEVKSYIKSQGIYFKVDPDDKLIEVVRYYDSLL